jgi:hypothetical protein
MKASGLRTALAALAAAAVIASGPAGPGAQAGPGEGPPEEQRPGTRTLGDGLIVPGQRIGPVRLGMSVDQIIAAVGGRPKRDEFAQEGIVLYEWRQEGLWVSQSASTKAIRLISVFGTSDKYRTEKGVTLMAGRTKLEEAYGKGYREYSYPQDRITMLRYHALGLQFSVVHQPSNPAIHNRVFQIGIFKPGDLPPIKRPSQ